MAEPSRMLDFEDVLASISSIARDPEHKQHFNALKMLAGMNSGVASLPEAKTDAEVKERLVRLLRGAGIELSRLAFHAAFPTGNFKQTIVVRPEDINVDVRTLPRTLKQYYKRYPWARRHGFPPGFPAGKGDAAKLEWLRRESIKAEAYKKQLELSNDTITEQPVELITAESEADGPAPSAG